MALHQRPDMTDDRERWNEKTRNYWAFKKFIHRLACVCEEYGISQSRAESVDESDVSWVWQPRGNGSARGYADVSVWLRGTRRPHGLRDVPSRTQRCGSQTNGTARVIRV